MAIFEFFDRGRDMDSASIAYVQDDQAWCFNLVCMLTGRIACGLMRLGLPKGTEVTANYRQPGAAHAVATANLGNGRR